METWSHWWRIPVSCLCHSHVEDSSCIDSLSSLVAFFCCVHVPSQLKSIAHIIKHYVNILITILTYFLLPSHQYQYTEGKATVLLLLPWQFEMRASLNKFEGSSSISSDELFGSGPNRSSSTSSSSFTRTDLSDIKEGVRQGVTKVAGRLSTFASGVMSSVQVRSDI